MPDPVTIGTLAAAALSMAAEAATKGVIGEAAKDIYKKLKNAVAQWASNDVSALEQNPNSAGRQSVLAEEIDRQSEKDRETIRDLARSLIEELKLEGLRDSRTNLTVTATHGSVAAGGNISGITTVSTKHGGDE